MSQTDRSTKYPDPEPRVIQVKKIFKDSSGEIIERIRATNENSYRIVPGSTHDITEGELICIKKILGRNFWDIKDINDC